MPVLPEVGSMIVPPGLSFPERSASSIMARPMRSLIDPPGFARSDFIHTSARSPNRRLIRMCGVLPMVSRTFAAIIALALFCWGGTHIGLVEAFCKAQFGEPPAPQEDDGDGSDPARDDRGDGADQRSQKAGFGLA